jgi:hypothetical protein
VRFATRLFAGFGCFLFARFLLGVECGFLARVARLRAGFDLGFRCRDGGQLIFPAGNLGGDVLAFGQVAPVSLFGLGEQFLGFVFELGFELAGVPIGQGAVAAGVGMQFGAVEAERAEAGELVGLGNFQDLYEERLKLRVKT